MAALLTLAAAGPLLAHGEVEVHLDPIVEHVGVRLPETVDDRKLNRAYGKLAKSFGAEEQDGLADDLKKLSAAAKQCRKALAADGTLIGLLDGAINEADGVLDARPAEAEELVDGILGESGRAKVEKILLKARSAHEEGGDSPDRVQRLGLFGKAERGYTKAEKVAQRLVDRQGGPLPQFLQPTPGHIYTFIGTGDAGHNGEGLSQRRSSLYWVEEVKFGPDGLLYLLDWNNHMVRRLEADGTLGRVCGAGTPGDSEGPALQTQLNHPSAVDFGPDGRIYIAAWHNHKVKVFDPKGPGTADDVVYTIAGGPAGNSGNGGPATDARFNLLPGVLLLPEGHAFGGGDLLVTDASNQAIRIVRLATDPVADTNVAGVPVQTGSVERVIGIGVQGRDGDGGPASEAKVGFSRSQNAESDGRMTMDGDGNLYFVSGAEHCVRMVTPDGTISTVAGTGTAGYSGDGGPATLARLDFPGDMAVASDGTIFISDQNNHCVRRVGPDGVITTVCGSPGTPGYGGDEGPASAALLHRPTGLELDGDGNLYVCDKGNSVVRVIASAAPGALMVPRAPYRLPHTRRGAPPAPGAPGTISTYAGSGRAAFNGDGLLARQTDFYWPQNVTVAPGSGLLYVVDWNNHRVRRIEADGTVRTVMGVGELGDTQGPALEVRMNHPTDLAFSPLDDELYVAGWHVDRIKKLVSSTNTVVTVNKPNGLRTFSGDGLHVSGAELNLPSGVKFDGAGNMYIADEGNRRIRRVDAISGIITTIVGDGVAGFEGDGGPGLSARLNLPVGQSAQPAGRVCVDPTDRYLYIADTDNHRVRRYDLQEDVITTVAGNGVAAFAGDGNLATDASLSSPVDVDCDAAGNLYICDRDNHAVRRVDIVTGAITTVAGTGQQGYAGDAGPATAARLFLPCGVFVDRSSGRLYIADTFNSVIRVVWE